MAEHAPEADDAPKKSVATRLVELAFGHYELRCTPDGEPYAIPQSGAAAGAAAARGPRVAAHDTALVLDLGDSTGRAVIITADSWSVVEDPPVRFRRTAATGALPEPTHGGSLAALWHAANVAERYRPLLLAALVAALIPDLPHPVVLITGEHGTGKSTATRRLASIIDPSPAQLRKPPRDVDAWTTAAAGSWVVALDNLSGVPDWLSDALCRASTGDGDLRRRLYTDGELHVIAFRRATMINGIDLGALRGDLADRLVHIVLDVIPPDQRRLDADLNTGWKQVHPRVLGAMLDLTVKVLAALPGIHPSELPRMADYARVLAAVDQVLGTGGLTTYRGLADDLARDALTSDPVLIALTATIRTEWTGTSTELLSLITPHDEHGRTPKDWPKARSLTAVLRRQAPALRRLGWTVQEIPRDATGYKVLRWRLKPPPPDGELRRAANKGENAETSDDSAGHSPAAGSANTSATARRRREFGNTGLIAELRRTQRRATYTHSERPKRRSFGNFGVLGVKSSPSRVMRPLRHHRSPHRHPWPPAMPQLRTPLIRRRRHGSVMTRPRCTPPDRGKPPLADPDRRPPDQIIMLSGDLAAKVYHHRFSAGGPMETAAHTGWAMPPPALPPPR